ncbi:hypothetical protein THAOC_23347, partial [Thalassiosira oceanica]
MGAVIGAPGEAMEELNSPYRLVPAEPTVADRVLYVRCKCVERPTFRGEVGE